MTFEQPRARPLGRKRLERALVDLTPPRPVCRDRAEEARQALDGVPQLAELERELGLGQGELDPWCGARPWIPGPRSARQGEFAVVSMDWRSLPGATLEAVLGELARGRAVVLVADETLPAVAEGALAALLSAGFEAQNLLLCAGSRIETEARLLADPRLGAWTASGARGAITRLRRGGLDRAGLETRLVTLRAGVFQGEPDDDPAALAERLLRAAFGRRETLGGLLPGQVSRAWIPARLMSAVTGELLARLAARPPELEPPCCPDPRPREWVEQALEEGLDEGATLLVEGDPRARRLGPTLFTNVEPHMGLSQATVPRPVLALLRQG